MQYVNWGIPVKILSTNQGGRRNNIRKYYKVNAYMQCLYTHTLFVKLIMHFETLWDEKANKIIYY